MNINSINVSNNNKVNSDYYLLNNKISTFNNLTKYLEYLLVDIIDDNMKYALKNYTPVTGKLRPYYYLTGSKAINNMVDFFFAKPTEYSEDAYSFSEDELF